MSYVQQYEKENKLTLLIPIHNSLGIHKYVFKKSDEPAKLTSYFLSIVYLSVYFINYECICAKKYVLTRKKRCSEKLQKKISQHTLLNV